MTRRHGISGNLPPVCRRAGMPSLFKSESGGGATPLTCTDEFRHTQHGVAFSPDGGLLGSVARARKVRLWA